MMRATPPLCRLVAAGLVGGLLAWGSLPAHSQTLENHIIVTQPAPGQTIEIQAAAGQTYVLDFPVDEFQVEALQDGNLAFGFDEDGDGFSDSRIVFLGMADVADTATFQVAGTNFSAASIVQQAIALVVREEEPLEEIAASDPLGDWLPNLPDLRHTGRDLLFQGEEERSGHPLYSYLLFAGASEGNREERARFNSAIEAFIGQVRSVEELESSGAARGEINIFYAPMQPIFEDTTPASLRIHFAQRSEAEQIALLKKFYDDARAEVLLGRMQLTGNGPFIVSVLRPLSHHPGRENEAFLVQDLSRVPPELVALWVDEFKRQVVSEATGSPENLRRVALNLRTQIAVLAEAFSITKSAVAEMFEAPDNPSGGAN